MDTIQGRLIKLGSMRSVRAPAGRPKSVTERVLPHVHVWHNEGDKSLPWIGTWKGKEKVLKEFLPAFGAGLKATSWTTDYRMASGDQAVFLGTMSATANKTGVDTGKFSWAVRVQVTDGKVMSWNWFENSFAVSKAYHAGGK